MKIKLNLKNNKISSKSNLPDQKNQKILQEIFALLDHNKIIFNILNLMIKIHKIKLKNKLINNKKNNY